MNVLAGRYQLDTPLGAGGSARVWRALDLKQRRLVAIKILPHAGATARPRIRLKAEAEVMASLRHPNVLRVFGLGSDGAIDWIAMEYCPGGSLADKLQASGPMSPRAATMMTLDVLEALAFAHERGVVHRDVKPDNILLGSDGRARLCDFGIARIARTTRFRHTLTGAVLGSYAYMAPEQRVNAHEVGPPADLYAVGCTLYALLTASTPTDLFLADASSPRWSDIPPELRPILQRSTRAAPRDRHADTHELTRDLRRQLGRLSTQPPPARQVSRPEGSVWPHTMEEATDFSSALPHAPLQFPTPVTPARELAFEDDFSTLPNFTPVPRPAPQIALTSDPASVIRGQRSKLLGFSLAIVVGVSMTAGGLAQREWPRPSSPPPAVETPSAPLDVRPEGTWHGLWESHITTVTIETVDEELRGTLDLTLPGGHRVSLDVSGSYSEESGIVTFRDVSDHPSAANYSLRLARHGNLLEGEAILHRTGHRAEVFLVRMN